MDAPSTPLPAGRAYAVAYTGVAEAATREALGAREAARRMGRSETAIHSLYRRALEAWQGDRILQGFSDESAGGPRSSG